LYAASCVGGPGVPYWLNDPCYAWVLEVDEYCCENAWDTICQLTYNHCSGGWSGDAPLMKRGEKIVLYPNPTQNFIYINNFVELSVYNSIGKLIESGKGNMIDLTSYSNGIYNIIIIFEGNISNHTIIKE